MWDLERKVINAIPAKYHAQIKPYIRVILRLAADYEVEKEKKKSQISFEKNLVSTKKKNI